MIWQGVAAVRDRDTFYCKCGEMITFVTTKAGKQMPCNLPRVDYIPKPDGPHSILTESGAVERGRIVGGAGRGTEKGYVVHWATCPYSEYQRRDKVRGQGDKAGRKAANPAGNAQLSMFDNVAEGQSTRSGFN